MAAVFKTCSVDGCNGVTGGTGARKGYCRPHYMRFWRYGDPLAGGRYVVRHGMSKTRLHGVWCGMLIRCGHKSGANESDTRNYINKGVRVCPDWHAFSTFAEWALANGYADDLTIDRIDSERGYSPGNCRWVTLRDNLRAKKNVRLSIEAAREIRRLRATGLSLSKIGAMFGTDPSSVRKIEKGLLWAE